MSRNFIYYIAQLWRMEDESVVIVDFERGVLNASDSTPAEEREKVKGILQSLKLKS